MITDAAVEAASRALQNFTAEQVSGRTWDQLTEPQKAEVRTEVRVTLKAAAPYLSSPITDTPRPLPHLPTLHQPHAWGTGTLRSNT